MKRRLKVISAVLTTLLAVAGCAVPLPGSAVPDPSEPAVLLDTGGLSTKPREPQTSERQQRVLAANMLGERAVAPWEIDSTFVASGPSSVKVILNAGNLGDAYAESMKNLLRQGEVEYGFTTSRHVANTSVTTGLLDLLLRMKDASRAAVVVSGFRAEQSEGEDYSITERPDVVAKKYDPIPEAVHTTIAVMFTVGPIVVFLRSWGPDAARAHSNAVQAIDKQRELLSGFVSPGYSELSSLPADQDAIVRHTVAPEPPAQGEYEQNYGFRAVAGELQWHSDPVETATLFAASGVDLVGYGRNVVYRARDEVGAKRMAAEWYRLLAQEKKAAEFSIPGLPAALCRTYAAGAMEEPRSACLLTVGRYVSEYIDAQPGKVSQVTSAAYLILRNAPR